MSIEMIVLRVLHVVLGIFWAGSAFFLASFLLPSLKASWPASAGVLLRLEERRWPVAIAVVGLLTILSGLRLYAILSNGFRPGWMSSGTGTAYGVGSVAALAAYGVGVMVIRPWAARLGVSLRAFEKGQEPERDAHRVAAEKALSHLTGGVRWAARLLGIAAIAMAVARYV